MGYGLGIDVGNTDVIVAVAATTGIELFTFGDRAVARPATVHLRGDDAPAPAEAASSPEGSGLDLTVGGFMSRLGDQESVIIGGAPYTVTDLLAILLTNVLEEVTAAHGTQPDHVVLAHPASWDPIRRELFKEATRRAGARNAFTVTEPEAAATYYSASQQWNDGDILAVYDLGATTFNATVLLKNSGGIDILGEPERVEYRGGDNRGDTFLPHTDGTVAAIERTIDTLSQALRSAQVAPEDLSAVLLVGGLSRVPLVSRMVSAKLGAQTVMDPRPQHVIALGAAMLAAHVVHADQPQRGTRERRDGERPEIQRLAVHGATTSTLTASSSTDATPRHDAPPQRLAGMIPAQRTPPSETLSAAALTATGDSEAGQDMLTVPIPAPAVTLRPTLPPRPRASLTPALRRTATPPRRAPANRRIRLRAFLILGMALGSLAVALVGSILLAMFSGRSGTRAPVPSALAQPPEPGTTAIPDQLDIGTPSVAATIPLPANPTFVTVSPDAKHAYIAHAQAQTVTVIDTASERVIATIPIASGPPQFLAFAPDGRTLYVSIFNDQRTIHSVDVLDTGSNTVVATIPQPARPFLPAVSPDGKRLYVPNHDVASISVIDIATHAAIAQIPVPPNPHWVDFSPDGSHAYTANHESNLVSSIDTTTLKVLRTIPVGLSPHSVAVNPHRPLAVDVNFDSASVTVIDTITQRVAATISVGQNPQDIAWSPDGRFAYAVNQGSNTISVIDSISNQVTATIPTGAGPTSIALLPHSHQAYVSDMDAKTLTVLDLGR